MTRPEYIEIACRAFFGDTSWDAPTNEWRDGKRASMGRALDAIATAKGPTVEVTADAWRFLIRRPTTRWRR